MILADTSLWVTHLSRGHDGVRAALEEGEVATHPFVIGELACGHLGNREEILSLLRALPAVQVATDEEFLRFVAAHRLHGVGLGFVDVHLLAAASLSGVPLWTTDRRLRSAAAKLSIAYP